MKMNRIRRIFSLLFVIAMMIGLVACSAPATTSSSASQTLSQTATPATTTESEAPSESVKPVKIRIAALKGPTGMGMVKLMADSDAGRTVNEYAFSLSGSPDDVVAQLTSGQVDIAALPTNLAAVLYQKLNGKIHLLAINTLGVLHILENGQAVNNISDLAGRTLYATGQGSVPEYVLADLLSRAGIADQVKVEFKAEHTELATLAAAGQVDLVMLPEPFATTVLAKNPAFRRAIDLNQAWEESQTDAGQNGLLAMGCLVVTDDLALANPDAIDSFLREYGESTDYVNTKPEEAGALIAKYGILPDAQLAAKAIPSCHIVMISDDQMADTINPLLNALFKANPKSIGGKLPDQDFYQLP